MEESILISIKKLLGITNEYTHFDTDIIIHINSVFVVLQQLGVGPDKGFYIEDDSATWADFIEDPIEYNAVKTYIYARVKLIFDPPASSSHAQALKDIISEFEWRMNIYAESQ